VVILLKIARTVTIDFEDLVKIHKKVEDGDFGSISEFFQKAIKNKLKCDIMSNELNQLLKQAYYRYLNENDPLIDPNDIKQFLYLEGVDLDDEQFSEESSRSLLIKKSLGGDKNDKNKRTHGQSL